MNIICSWHVANSFIKLSFTEKNYVNYEKLNYLIFLLYSNYLYNTGEKLFTEQFMKADKGFYLFNIYSKFGSWGKDAIKGYAHDAMGKVKYISDNDIFDKCILYIWNLYKNMSAIELLLFLENNYPCLKKKPRTVIKDIDILNDEININEKMLENAKGYRKILQINNI